MYYRPRSHPPLPHFSKWGNLFGFDIMFCWMMVVFIYLAKPSKLNHILLRCLDNNRFIIFRYSSSPIAVLFILPHNIWMYFICLCLQLCSLIYPVQAVSYLNPTVEVGNDLCFHLSYFYNFFFSFVLTFLLLSLFEKSSTSSHADTNNRLTYTFVAISSYAPKALYLAFHIEVVC